MQECGKTKLLASDTQCGLLITKEQKCKRTELQGWAYKSSRENLIYCYQHGWNVPSSIG